MALQQLPLELMVHILELRPGIIAALRGTCRAWRAAANVLAGTKGVTPQLLVPYLCACAASHGELQAQWVTSAFSGKWIHWQTWPAEPLREQQACRKFASMVIELNSAVVAERLLSVPAWFEWLFVMLCGATATHVQAVLLRAAERGAPPQWGLYEATYAAARAHNGALTAALMTHGTVPAEALRLFAQDTEARRIMLGNPGAVAVLREIDQSSTVALCPDEESRIIIARDLAAHAIPATDPFSTIMIIEPEHQHLFVDVLKGWAEGAGTHHARINGLHNGLRAVDLVHNRNLLARRFRLAARVRASFDWKLCETYVDVDGNELQVIGVDRKGAAAYSARAEYERVPPIFSASTATFVRRVHSATAPATGSSALPRDARYATRDAQYAPHTPHDALYAPIMPSDARYAPLLPIIQVASTLRYTRVEPDDWDMQGALLRAVCRGGRVGRSPRLCAMLQGPGIRAVEVATWDANQVGFLCMRAKAGPSSLCFVDASAGMTRVASVFKLDALRMLLHDVRAMSRDAPAVMSEEGIDDITTIFRDEWAAVPPTYMRGVPQQRATQIVADVTRARILEAALAGHQVRLPMVADGVRLALDIRRLGDQDSIRGRVTRHLNTVRRSLRARESRFTLHDRAILWAELGYACNRVQNCTIDDMNATQWVEHFGRVLYGV